MRRKQESTDGWGIAGVEGDEIQLIGTSQTGRITQVDYTDNTITVDRNLTWTPNQGISLKYEGSAPDVGAFELNQNSINPPEKAGVMGSGHSNGVGPRQGFDSTSNNAEMTP